MRDQARSGRVLILGAGPAGLAAGFALAKADWDVHVVEQGQIVGGLARTEERDGFRFDIGGHRWFTKQDELNQFLIDLLGDELILVNRTSRILFRGKSVDYPLRLTNALASIGPLAAVRAAGDLLQMYCAPGERSTPGRSMEDAYIAQYGRTLYELFFRNYSEKVWGRHCDELSGDWVVQRTRGLSLNVAIRDALRRTNGAVESLVDRFMYPARGYGRISERMAEQVAGEGGQIDLGWRVTRARHDTRGRLTDVTVVKDGHERRLSADWVVSSIPMTELVHILEPTAPERVLQATRTLTYRHLVTAHLFINRPRVTNDTWIYVHEPDVSFARLHEPRNWSQGLAPPGRTSLVLELFCEASDDIWNAPDELILARVEADLTEKLRLLEPGDMTGGFVLRSADAYPRYGLGYREAVDAVRGYLGAFDNLAIVGRGGTFRYNNTDHAIESGLLAARHILGEQVDSTQVNVEPEYLEQRTVKARRIAYGA